MRLLPAHPLAAPLAQPLLLRVARVVSLALAAALCGPLTGPAVAQAQAALPGAAPSAPSTGSRSAGSLLERSDRNFLIEAARAGHLQREAGQMALGTSAHTQVKGFAQQQVDDQAKLAAALATLALAKGVSLPAVPSLMQRGRLRVLAGARGEAFDRRYAGEVAVKAQRGMLDLFEKAARRSRDADIQGWAQQSVPGLKHQLEMARSMQSAVEAAARASAARAASGR